MEEESNSSRRRFLGAMTFAIGGLLSVGFIVPAIAYIVGPALKRGGTKQWITLGSTAKIEPGTPTLFKAKVERQSGWIVTEEEISAYVLTVNSRDFVAMSNICTHLGCHIRWIAEKGQFYCPCHNAVFDKDGNVVAGPPPRPLDRYEVKVENGNLLILGG